MHGSPLAPVAAKLGGPALILAQEAPGVGTVITISVTVVGAMAAVVAALWRSNNVAKDTAYAQALKDNERLRLDAEADKARLRDRMEAQLAEQRSQNETLQKLLKNSTTIAEQIVQRDLEKKGLPVVKSLADVVPIHNSPVTDKQIVEAAIFDATARVAALSLAAKLAHPEIVLPPMETAAEVKAGPRTQEPVEKERTKEEPPVDPGAGSIKGEITKPGGSDPVKFAGIIEPSGESEK
jgi:hypothetical protein